MRTIKAWVAGVVAIADALTVALVDNVLGFEEVGTITSVVVVTALGIFAVYKSGGKNGSVDKPTNRVFVE